MQRSPEGLLDAKIADIEVFKIPSLKFGVDLLSTGHLSRLFDPATGSLKMRNHFPVILALLILYQLPYGIKKIIGPVFHHLFMKLVGSSLNTR